MKTRKPVLIAGVAMIIAALACTNPLQRNAEPTPTLFVIPTSDPGGGDAAPEGPADTGDTGDTNDAAGDSSTSSGDASGDGETILFKGLGLDQIDSYIATITVQFDGTLNGAASTMNMDGTMLGQADPYQTQMEFTITQEGAAAINSSFNVVTMDNTTYLETSFAGAGNTCFSFPEGQENPMAEQLINVEEFIGSDQPNLQLIDPNADVNGISARHYRVEGYTGTDLENATIDVWTTQDQTSALRIIMVTEGDQGDMGTGTMTLTYEVTSLNQA